MTKAINSKSKGAKSAGTISTFPRGGNNQQSLPGPSVATRSHGPVDDDNDSVGSRSLSTNGGGAYGYSIEYLGAEIPELFDRIEQHRQDSFIDAQIGRNGSSKSYSIGKLREEQVDGIV